MKIAVVILNWNGKELLEKFLPSVVNHSQNTTIYIADNASTDNSVTFIKNSFPTVKIIQNSQNGGYAKGYNDALKQVNEDIYCLLNSDVEVSKNWLTPILEVFANNPDTAIIQPKILDHKDKTSFEYAGAAGGFIDKYGYPFCRGRIFSTLEKDKGQYNDTIDIFWASGACFFIRKDAFNALNGFDETYFAHMEEIDLCWRAFNHGYTTKFVGNSTVYHVGAATLKETSPKKTYLNFRNSLFTLVKNASGPIFFLVLIRLLLDGLAGIKFIFELKPKHCFAIIKAHASFYVNLSRLLKQRRKIEPRKNYYKLNSIVWAYFFNNQKTFKCL